MLNFYLEDNGMLNLSNRKSVHTLLMLSMFFVLFGCEEEVAPAIERIRAIKAITVTERAFGINRSFPGLVEAVDKSSLSFEVSGNVRALRVQVGDPVKIGEVIGTLARRPFELNVQAAEAEVKRVQVDLNNKKKNFQRFEAISKVDAGAVSQKSLDQATAAYESAYIH